MPCRPLEPRRVRHSYREAGPTANSYRYEEGRRSPAFSLKRTARGWFVVAAGGEDVLPEAGGHRPDRPDRQGQGCRPARRHGRVRRDPRQSRLSAALPSPPSVTGGGAGSADKARHHPPRAVRRVDTEDRGHVRDHQPSITAIAAWKAAATQADRDVAAEAIEQAHCPPDARGRGLRGRHDRAPGAPQGRVRARPRRGPAVRPLTHRQPRRTHLQGGSPPAALPHAGSPQCLASSSSPCPAGRGRLHRHLRGVAPRHAGSAPTSPTACSSPRRAIGEDLVEAVEQQRRGCSGTSGVELGRVQRSTGGPRPRTASPGSACLSTHAGSSPRPPPTRIPPPSATPCCASRRSRRASSRAACLRPPARVDTSQRDLDVRQTMQRALAVVDEVLARARGLPPPEGRRVNREVGIRLIRRPLSYARGTSGAAALETEDDEPQRARSAHSDDARPFVRRRPTGDTAHRDLYEHLVTEWPDVVALDRPRPGRGGGRLRGYGGSSSAARTSHVPSLSGRGTASTACAPRLPDELLSASTELERLLALRPAEDVELDLGYGIHNPLDDLDERIVYHRASLGDRLGGRPPPGVVARHAPPDGNVDGRPALHRHAPRGGDAGRLWRAAVHPRHATATTSSAVAGGRRGVRLRSRAGYSRTHPRRHRRGPGPVPASGGPRSRRRSARRSRVSGRPSRRADPAAGRGRCVPRPVEVLRRKAGHLRDIKAALRRRPWRCAAGRARPRRLGRLGSRAVPGGRTCPASRAPSARLRAGRTHWGSMRLCPRRAPPASARRPSAASLPNIRAYRSRATMPTIRPIIATRDKYSLE